MTYFDLHPPLVTKCLVAWKLRESALVRPAITDEMQASMTKLDQATSCDDVRMIEAAAVRAYWSSWSTGLW